MTTDLEGQLSARLRREAAELVPDGIPIPPLPTSVSRQGRWRTTLGQGGARWRTPALVAVAVLLVAVATTIVVRIHRGDATTAAELGQLSPVTDSPTAPFDCGNPHTLTDHAASVAGVPAVRIGVTSDWFCVMEPNNQGAGTGLTPGKVFESVLADQWVVAGVVAPSVDRLVWTPDPNQDQRPTTLDLYVLGPSRGFATPSGSGGTLTAYSGGVLLDQQDVPDPTRMAAPLPASSEAATTLSAATIAQQTSPVLDSFAAAFGCGSTTTLHAAQAGPHPIGVTGTAFCVSTDEGTAGTPLKVSGALRAMLSSRDYVAGVVDTTVDRIVWLPHGGDATSRAIVDLYRLGTLNGFGFATATTGLLTFYSGPAVVAVQSVTTGQSQTSPAVTTRAGASSQAATTTQ